MKQDWLIYGAYGYTGELMVREAVRRGHAPIIGGRSRDKLQPLADELRLQIRVFDVQAAAGQLDDLGLVLNCAGPFSATAGPMVEACLAAGTHYVDISGEIPVFELCHGLASRARAAGVILCPGAGFDIVPTDCLAVMLQQKMPDAQRLDLAFSFGTRPSIGTANTIIEGIETGGLIRRDGQLHAVPNGYRLRRIGFPSGKRWTVTIPWGDVFSAGVSTRVPNGMVYTALPLAVGLLMKLTSPFSGLLAMNWANRLLKRIAQRYLGGGPDAQALASEGSEFWGEAVDSDGRHLVATMTAPNVYALTVDTAIEISQYCLGERKQAGYCTPSMLLGADFVTTRNGVTVQFYPGGAF